MSKHSEINSKSIVLFLIAFSALINLYSSCHRSGSVVDGLTGDSSSMTQTSIVPYPVRMKENKSHRMKQSRQARTNVQKVSTLFFHIFQLKNIKMKESLNFDKNRAICSHCESG